MLLQENTMFANRYQLERLLGRGGFSEVWLAKDSYTKLDIAIKVYAPGQGMDSDGLADFSQELAGVFNLNHTNLLKPTHVDAWEGMPYLIMSFCSRGSLTKQIGKLSEQELWHVLHDVAAGLAYLHKNDIVHQDIKPDNILLDESGNYVITDFGISTKARSTLRKSVIGGTLSGGTMAYMGPERFSKQPAPTKASDIWSLGAMMFELVTGNVPFGEMGGGMQKGGAEIPEIAEDISSELKTTIEQMLALETWDRPTADKLTEIASAHLSAMPTPAPQKEVRSTIPQQPKQEQPSSSHETQRFVSKATADTQTTSQESKQVNSVQDADNSKSWRWLPIVELVLMTPFLIYSMLLFAQLMANAQWLTLSGVLVFASYLLCLAVYYLLLELAITKKTIRKNWASGALAALLICEVCIELRLQSDFTIVLISLAAFCLILWFIFQSRIIREEAGKNKKTFIVVLAIFYFLYIGWTLLCGLGQKKDLDKSAQVEEQIATESSMSSEILRYKEECEKFMKDNESFPGVITTSSGLQYEIIKQGKGIKPSLSSTIKVHYEGKLIDNTIFDSSYERGEPIEFPLNGVIAGWQEGLQLMPVGSKYRLYIPQELAYGSQGYGPIPPYAAVIFVVELLEVDGEGTSQQNGDSKKTKLESKLLGKHKLRLQWLEPAMGEITIADKYADNWFYGSGKISGSNGYLKIEGQFSIVDENNVLFQGKIEESISYIANGQVAYRNGLYHFKSYNGRKYWRMQEMSNPIDEVTDYIDIFF